MSNTAFLKLAAISAILSVFSTLGVHFIEFPAETFEARLLLAHDTWYIAHRWMIIFHCMMVIISMCGAAILLLPVNKGLTSLGMLFFAVFGIAEITRMFSVLAWLNPMREKYLGITDESVRQILQLQIEAFSQGTLILFLVFIFAFALGNLFYGLTLFGKRGSDKWMGWAFLVCAVFTFLSFGNTFWESETVGAIVEWSGKIYTPLLRLGIGIWLWKKSMEE